MTDTEEGRAEHSKGRRIVIQAFIGIIVLMIGMVILLTVPRQPSPYSYPEKERKKFIELCLAHPKQCRAWSLEYNKSRNEESPWIVWRWEETQKDEAWAAHGETPQEAFENATRHLKEAVIPREIELRKMQIEITVYKNAEE